MDFSGFDRPAFGAAARMPQIGGTPQRPQTQTQPKKKGFWLDQISTAGGILGGIGGSFVAPILGTGAGAAVGSGLGEAIENIITGDDWNKNVGKEAALGGVFGAGPIKLAKGGFGGAKALLTGADDVVGAASRAAMTPLRKKAGQAILGVGDDLALKNFKINDSNFINNFKRNIGEDPGKFARTRGFVGKTPEEITETVYRPLQDIYKQSISKIAPIPKAEIEKGLRAVYEPLLNDIAKDNRLLGQQLKSQADDVLRRLSKNVNPADAYDIKITFDTLVDQKLTDSAGKLANNVNKQIADVFRNAINKQADSSGVKFAGSLPVPGVKATNLKELGKELQGIMEFADKAAIKSQVGRGKNIIGLTPTMAASGGIASGNPLLALAGAGGVMAANSKTGSQVASKAITGIGNRLANASSKQTPLGIAGRVVAGNQMFSNQTQSEPANAVGLEDALIDAQSGLENNVMPANNINTSNANNMSGMYQNTQQQSTPYSKENLLADIQRDPQNMAQYINYYQTLSEIFTPVQEEQEFESPYSRPTASQYSQGIAGLQSVDKIEELFNSEPGLANKNAIPGQRLPGVGGLVSRAAGTSTYRGASNNVLNSIARINTGANMPESEREFYEMTYLPQPGDDPQTVQYKLNNLRQFFKPIVSYSGSGNPLENALMQTQQGGY